MKVGHRPRADWAGGRPDSVSTRCWTQKQRSGREGSRKRPELAPQGTLESVERGLQGGRLHGRLSSCLRPCRSCDGLTTTSRRCTALADDPSTSTDSQDRDAFQNERACCLKAAAAASATCAALVIFEAACRPRAFRPGSEGASCGEPFCPRPRPSAAANTPTQAGHCPQRSPAGPPQQNGCQHTALRQGGQGDKRGGSRT